MDKQDALETVTRWLNHELVDDYEVNDLVRRDPEWRQALHDALAMFTRLRFFRRHRNDTLSVALDRNEIRQAERFHGLILNMPLPHEGDGAALKALLTPGGILFYADIPGEHTRTRLCPWGAKEFVWRDRVLELTFELVEQEERQAWRRSRAANDVCALAYGAGHSRALEHALNTVDDLKGYWASHLANAAHAFDESLEEPDDLQEHLAMLVRLRVGLDVLARRLCDGILDFELAEADALLEQHKEGLLLLDDEFWRYLDYDEDGPVDKTKWWRFPQLLDEKVPTCVVLAALEELARAQGLAVDTESVEEEDDPDFDSFL